MASSKYVDVISNASIREYAENKPAAFTNRLAKTLTLEGNWEVGLLEIVHPKISSISKHKGEVYLHGNVPDMLTTKFEIDFSKSDPYQLMEKAAKKVEDLSNGNTKTRLHKDINGIYSILVGWHKVPDKWKCTTHILVDTDDLSYLGFSSSTFKNPKGQTFNDSDLVYHENLAPTPIESPKKFKMKIWTDPKEEDMTVDTPANVPVSKLAQIFNEAIHKHWEAKKVNYKTHPKPSFRIGKDGRLEYRPGLIQSTKNESVMLRFDTDTMFLLGFKDWDTTKIEPITAYYRPYMGNSHLVYFYADVVQEHHQGDIMGSTLRVLPITDKKEVYHTRFSPIIYHPVKRKMIDTISVSINDDSGRNPTFIDGVTHATLHFRKSEKLY